MKSPAKNPLELYLTRQATSKSRYAVEQLLTGTVGWVPSIVGIGLRNYLYRLAMHIEGTVAIEKGVRLRFLDNISLGDGVYLDESVYLHASPGGIKIEKQSYVMHGSILHVYNFRDLPHAGIHIGESSLIGEMNVLRGQGGITIGSRVYTSPLVQILAVNHVYQDPNRSFTEQGITAEGIRIADDVWIGAGAVITDGVQIGAGAVVAAGSVVVDDVAARTLVAGIPAREIRKINDPQEMPDVPVYHRLKGETR